LDLALESGVRGLEVLVELRARRLGLAELRLERGLLGRHRHGRLLRLLGDPARLLRGLLRRVGRRARGAALGRLLRQRAVLLGRRALGLLHLALELARLLPLLGERRVGVAGGLEPRRDLVAALLRRVLGALARVDRELELVLLALEELL